MIPNEDSLKSRYDRMNAPEHNEAAAELERRQEEARRQVEENISDKMEQIFGVR